MTVIEELPDVVSDDKHVEDLKYYGKRKLVVDWSGDDSRVLAHIRKLAQDTYLEIFGDTLDLLAELTDKIGEDGNMGLITTKDLEGYIMKLSNEKINTSLQINAVKMDALFAKYSLDDDYHEAYMRGKGTNNLREAEAHTETVEKRYAYFFRYYVHTMCDGLGRDIDSLIKNLNSVLFRRGSNG